MRLTPFRVALVATVALGALPIALASVDMLRAPLDALAALADPIAWERIGASYALLAFVLAVAVPIGVVLAWLLARTDLPFRRVLAALLVLPLFLPPLVHALTWATAFRFDGMAAIVVVHAMTATPIVMLLAMRSLRQVGRARRESALLLGGRRAAVLDEFRQAIPGALAGAALAAVFVVGDFAVADFLTSVGAKFTVAADSVYVHHQGLRGAAAFAVALPIALPCAAFLWLTLRRRSGVGATVGARFEPAPPVPLRRAKWPTFAAVASLGVVVSAVPFGALAVQAGSFARVVEHAGRALDRIGTTMAIAAAAATLIVAIALPLALRAARRPSMALDLLITAPLAVPALTLGIGLVRTWNHAPFDAIYTGPAIVVLAAAGRYLAFGYLPLADAAARVDRSLDEAARVAGGAPFSRFARVTWPLIRTSALGAWCVAFAFALRETDASVLLRAGQSSLTYHLYSHVVFAREADVAAIALLVAGAGVLPLAVHVAVVRTEVRIA